MKKKLIQTVLALLVLVFLLVPAMNPFLDAAGKAAVTAQLQDTFGGLLGGNGNLTPARLTSAAAVVLVVWLVCNLLFALLNLITEKKKDARSMAGLFTSLIKFLGVIVGFGAQSLIEDAVTGIFIIFEGQYRVGDIIVLDGFRGMVKRIGIRTTVIVDGAGNEKIVNNSDIRNVQNRSTNTSLAVADLCISYNADIREVEKVLARCLPAIHTKYPKLFLTAPRYMGVESLGESSVVLRIVADIKEEDFFTGYRTLNRELKLMCDQNDIEIPFNQLVNHHE